MFFSGSRSLRLARGVACYKVTHMPAVTEEFSTDALGARVRANRGNLVLAALGFIPLLGSFFILSWSRPAYQFFPLALVATVMLGARAVKSVRGGLSAGNLAVSRALVLTTGAVWLWANYHWSPWLGFIAFLLGLTAILWGLGGWPLCRAFVPVILMLLAILPPPFKWDQSLTLWLRSVAVHTSCGLLDWLRITFVQDGNTIQLPGKVLFVEEACSGINSFVLCNAFCLFWLLWRRRPLWWLLPSLPATSLFVVLGNVIRITVCSLAFSRWHLDLLEGWRHETFGLVLLLGYCGLVMSVEQCLIFLTQAARPPAVPGKTTTPPPGAETLAAPPVPTARSPRRSGPVLGFPWVAPILALAGLGAFAAHLFLARGCFGTLWPGLTSSRELTLSLPPSLGGWQRVTASSGDQAMIEFAGVHSSVWHFQLAGSQASVAVDYPLDGFHNVRICYEANGWRVAAEDKVILPPGREDPHALRLTLDKQPYRHALVFHSVIDAQGRWLADASSLASRFAGATQAPTGYRIQLIIEGYGPIPADSAARAQELFFQARQFLVPQMVEQLSKPAAR